MHVIDAFTSTGLCPLHFICQQVHGPILPITLKRKSFKLDKYNFIRKYPYRPGFFKAVLQQNVQF